MDRMTNIASRASDAICDFAFAQNLCFKEARIMWFSKGLSDGKIVGLHFDLKRVGQGHG